MSTGCELSTQASRLGNFCPTAAAVNPAKLCPINDDIGDFLPASAIADLPATIDLQAAIPSCLTSRSRIFNCKEMQI